jgi:hypothetical protein
VAPLSTRALFSDLEVTADEANDLIMKARIKRRMDRSPVPSLRPKWRKGEVEA